MIDYQDNGCGIKEQELDRIFDPFYTMKKNKDRSGLGLFGIKHVIENQLNGSINLLHKVESGVHFIVDFPTE